MPQHHRNIKIIATVGPACDSQEAVEALFHAGAHAFRVNMGHGDPKQVAKWHGIIRGAEAAVGRPIGILVDLQGPKLRIDTFANDSVRLEIGASFRIDLDPTPGDANRVCMPHPEIFEVLSAGSTVLLNDGKIDLEVVSAGAAFAETRVRVGGELSNRKGVNLPDTVLPVEPITEKDKTDLAAALDLGIDWVALSFVQRPADIVAARELIKDRAGLIAKIEKPQALDSIDDIVALSDGVMVARGDLGVEMAVEDVPGAQKKIIATARKNGKLVVVATQMLESMTTAPVPTRAEVSDVANAVFEGADAVMLSAESATGDYPVEAVSVMQRVGNKIERDPLYRTYIESVRTSPEATSADAITAAARQVAETMDASAIVTYTKSGSTALRASRERPRVPILVLTPEIKTARRLSFGWGMHCVIAEDAKNFSDMVDRACRIAAEQGFGQKNDHIVVTAGVPFGTPGKTNVLRIARLRTGTS